MDQQRSKPLVIPGVSIAQPYLEPFALSALVKTVFAPLERYRLIRQTQDLLTLYEREHVKSFFSFAKDITNKQGYTSLWKSNYTSILLFFPKVISQAIFYENIKYALVDTQANFVMKAASASLCSITTLLLAYPFDTVRIRQATEIGNKQSLQYKRFTKSYSMIKRREGLIKGLYSGLSIAVLHNVLLAPLTLLFAELLDANITQEQVKQHQVAIAYLTSFIILYPLDSIRHRQQIRSILFNQETSKQKAFFARIKSTVANPSIGWLYGGLSSHILRSSLQVLLISNIQNPIQQIRSLY